MNKKINILGIEVDAVSNVKVIEEVDKLISNSGRGYVTVTGVHGIMEAQRSLLIKAAHDNAWMTVPDGMPLVYIGWLLGVKVMRRCYGPDLMHAVIQHSVPRGYTHYLLGGGERVAEELSEVLERKYPGVKIVGTYTPPFRPLSSLEKHELLEEINSLHPNIIWVGLGTPKQELFMSELIDSMKVNVMFGVGAAFDFHVGKLTSAPDWMQYMALEWLYRLLQEPKRLWKRYLFNNPLFIFLVMLQLFKIRGQFKSKRN